MLPLNIIRCQRFIIFLSADEFVEKQILGNKILTFEKKASILPDRNFVMDLLSDHDLFAEVCSKEDYDNFS